MSETAVTYFPGVFDVDTLDEAMRIIRTAEDPPARHCWATETLYLADLNTGAVDLSDRSLVLDYGCGISRMAGSKYSQPPLLLTYCAQRSNHVIVGLDPPSPSDVC
jgi:hypothetical protein